MFFKALLMAVMVAMSLSIPHQKLLRRDVTSDPPEDYEPMSDDTTHPTTQGSTRCPCMRSKRETHVDKGSGPITSERPSGTSQASVSVASDGKAYQAPAADDGIDLWEELRATGTSQSTTIASSTQPNGKSDGKASEATTASTAYQARERRSSVVTTLKDTVVKAKTGIPQKATDVVPTGNEILAANKTDLGSSSVAKAANNPIGHIDVNGNVQNSSVADDSLKEPLANNDALSPVSSLNVSANATNNENGDLQHAVTSNSSDANKIEIGFSPVAKAANSTIEHIDMIGNVQNASIAAASLKDTNNDALSPVSSLNVSVMTTNNETGDLQLAAISNLSISNATGESSEANETVGSSSIVAKTNNATVVQFNLTEIAQNATLVAGRSKVLSQSNMTSTDKPANETDKGVSAVGMAANATVAQLKSTGIAQNVTETPHALDGTVKNNTAANPVGATNASTPNENDYTDKYDDHYGGPSTTQEQDFVKVANPIFVSRKPSPREYENMSIKQMVAFRSQQRSDVRSVVRSASSNVQLWAPFLAYLPVLAAYLRI